MGNEKETVLEVPVQEQLEVQISFDKKLLDKKVKRIEYLTKELRKEIKSLGSTMLIK